MYSPTDLPSFVNTWETSRVALTQCGRHDVSRPADAVQPCPGGIGASQTAPLRSRESRTAYTGFQTEISNSAASDAASRECLPAGGTPGHSVGAAEAPASAASSRQRAPIQNMSAITTPKKSQP